MSFGVFSDRRIQRVIERFGSARKMMIFAGAGISVEAGLPTWERLAQRLLRRAAIQGRYFDAGIGDAGGERDRTIEIERWVEETLRRESLMRAASLAEELLGGDLPTILTEELYKNDLDPSKTSPHDYEPGPIAREIANLRVRFAADPHRRLKLFTTNYDDLLVVALRAEKSLTGYTVYPYVDPEAKEPTTLPLKVHHLHGYIGRDETAGNIVLTEESFLDRDSSPDDWRVAFVKEALRNQPCLFVGTSLTDFNLTRYLHEHSSTHKHAVVFVRQAEEIDEPPMVRRLREEAAIKRWGRKNLDVIFLDHFADVAQLIHEIALRVGGDHDGQHVDQRARQFLQRTHDAVIQADDPAQFIQAQWRANSALRSLRDEVVNEMGQRGCDLADESLTLGIWLFDEDGMTMRAWASTDRIHIEPQTIQAITLDPASRWVAAQAACIGERVDEYRNYRDTRWSYIAAMPIYAHFGGRVPVGIATVASVAPMGESRLGTLATRDQSFLEKMIMDGVCDWFNETLKPAESADIG